MHRLRTKELEKADLPLLFDIEFNFRIESIGQSKNIRRTINAVTYDIDSLTPRYVEILDKIDKAAADDAGDTGKPDDKDKDKDKTAGGTGGDKPVDQNAHKEIPKGRPTIVYWMET